MKKTFVRLLSVAMCVVMTLTAAPLGGLVGLELPGLFDFKAEAASYSGTCGDNLTWSFDRSTGVLEITGTGAMTNYSPSTEPLWSVQNSYIKTVNIGNGVTTIGSYAFQHCSNLTNVYCSSVTTIGNYAFQYGYNLINVYCSSVTFIGAYAFQYCHDLTNVYYGSDEEDWNKITIGYGNDSLTSATIHFAVDPEECEHPEDQLSWETVKEATCVPGLEAATCAVCGMHGGKGTVVCDGSTYPESKHNYANNANQTWNFSYPCAEKLILKFSDSTETEGGWDYIYLYDGNGTELGKYSGTELSGKEIEIEGSCFSIKLTSDSSANCYGFEFDSISAYINCLNRETPAVSGHDWSAQNGVCANGCGTECTHTASLQGVCDVCGRSCEVHGHVFKTVSGGCSVCGQIGGICGDDLTWSFDKDTGVLNITGTGAMTNWSHSHWSSLSPAPWYGYSSSVKSITISYGVTSIGEYAFYSCENLASVSIPESVKKISKYAFAYCETLADITIPDSITSIGAYAFNNCNALTSITIPGGVTTVGEYAFSGCSNLESVTISDSVTNIHYSALPYGLTSINVDSNNKYYSSDSYGVLFNKNKTQLIKYSTGNTRKSYVIPDSVTAIGKSAFYGCASLTSIVIPESVTFIDSAAFDRCSSLEKVIYKGTEEQWANVTINPNNPHLDSIVFEKEKPYCASGVCGEDIEWRLYDNGELVIKGTGAMQDWSSYSDVSWYSNRSDIRTVTISDGITTIGNYAFYGCDSMTTVTVPDSVTSIGECAFYNCKSLESATIPDDITAIGSFTFYNCEKIIDITIPDGVTTIGDNAFCGCTGLASIIIPGSVTTIGDNAFSSCTGLTSVNIPDSITDIGDNAFCGCTGLASIIIPDSITTIGDYAFYNCSGIKELTMPASAKIYNSSYTFGGCINIEKITLTKGTGAMQSYSPDTSSNTTTTDCKNTPWYISGCETIIIENGVTTIGDYAFYGCSGITSVTIPDSVTGIGAYAFYNCSGITSVTIGKSVTGIGDYAFYNCSGITSVTIGKSVTGIGDYAFYNCSSIEFVTLPDSVITIGNYAFTYCKKLYRVYFSNNMKVIGEYAFGGCTRLSDVTLPDGLTTIGEGAFSGCSSLNSVTIPGSVKAISDGMFYCCKSLDVVTVADGVTAIGEYAFYECSNIDVIAFPDSVTAIGKYAFYSCDLLNYVILPDSITSIGEYAFYDCDNLINISSSDKTEIAIPDGVTTIGDYAFYDCDLIINLTIPDSVTSIGEKAFGSCTALKNLKISNSLRDIGPYAFWDCYCLRRVIIPDGVTTIGDYMFYKCTLLEDVTIGAGVTTIGKSAFEKCSFLTDISYVLSEEDWNRITIVEGNDKLASVTIHYNWVIHDHDYIWLVETVPTTTQSGSKKQVCTICGKTKGESVEIPATSFETTNGMVVDYASNMVFGLAAGISSLEGFATVVVDGCELEYVEGKNGFGTGTKAVIKNGDEIIEEYTIVIFGDIQGDGWYDANDAFLVNMMALGLLDESKLSDAEKAAADCNHDGVINELDFELLINASVLLEDVDQSATKEDLATNAMYISYCSLIDQTAGEETNLVPTPDDNEAPSDNTADIEPSESAEASELEAIFIKIIDFFKKIFSFLFSFIIN